MAYVGGDKIRLSLSQCRRYVKCVICPDKNWRRLGKAFRQHRGKFALHIWIQCHTLHSARLDIGVELLLKEFRITCHKRAIGLLSTKGRFCFISSYRAGCHVLHRTRKLNERYGIYLR